MQRLASDNVLKEIFNNAPCGLHSLDTNGIYIAINETELNWLGYEYDEIVGKLTFSELCTTASREKFKGLFPGFVKTGYVRDLEFDMIKKDGTILPVLINSRANYDKEGKFINTHTFVLNLTEVKTAQQAVESKTKSLELLTSIGKSISRQMDMQVIMQEVTDATTKLTNAQFGAFFHNVINENGEAFMLYTLSGASREKFEKFGLPRNTAVFHPTFTGEAVVRSDDITADPRYGKNAPFYGMPKGHLPVVSYLAVPVISKTGDVIGGLFYGHSKKGIFTKEVEDMVIAVAAQAAIALDNAKLFEELKNVNSENEKLLEMARELDAKKNEFISMASHELKTPLTSIKGYVQLLEIQLQDKGDAYKYIIKTGKAIDRLQQLIEDLLDVSKIQAGRLKFHMSEFNLEDVLTEAIEEIQHIAPNYTITIKSKSASKITGDKNRIIQVLMNLLNNAIKYSPDGDKIEIHINEANDEIIVAIKDFGIGIPAEHHSRIFERFHRVSEEPNFTGLGIGLYISNEIVQRHNGNMWVKSTPGEGSTFYFTLPRHSAHKKN